MTKPKQPTANSKDSPVQKIRKNDLKAKEKLRKALQLSKQAKESIVSSATPTKAVPSISNGIKKSIAAQNTKKVNQKANPVVSSLKTKQSSNVTKPVPSSANTGNKPSKAQKRKMVHQKTDSALPSSSKPKPEPSSSTTEAKSSKTKPQLKPTKKASAKTSLKNEFVENELVAKVNCNNVSFPPSKSRKVKRTQDNFTEESIDVTKVKAKKAKSNGFIETNADNEEETKLVNAVLQKQRIRFIEAMGDDPTIPLEKFSKNEADEEPKPSIVVHNVVNGGLSAANTASSASDSEDGSYIDKFFNNRNVKGEFNSNDALSIDEFEKLSEHNGFVSGSDGNESISELDESTTNDDSESSMSSIGNAASASTKNSKSNDHKKQLVHYNGNDSDDSDDYDVYDDSDDSDESDEYYRDVDSDEYDFGDYFREMDGEYISDGDDYGGNFTGSSDDGEGEEEEEDLDEEETDYSMYEEETSDYGDESSDDEHYDESYDSDSDEHDEYDDFMSGRFKDDSNDTDFHDSDYDDLVIAHGTAISYKLNDSRIKLFENDTKARIVELPKSDTEDENVVELVSLNVTREEIVSTERHKRQTKKMHQDLEALKIKQREVDHQRKYEAYFKLDESQATSSSASETQIEDTKPVVITCLPGIVGKATIGDCFSDESTSDTNSDQLNLGDNVNLMDQTVITAVPIKIPPAEDMEAADPSDNSEGDEATPEKNEAAAVPVKSNSVGYSESERIKDRNTNLTKSQIAKTKPIFFNSINSQHVLLLLRNIIHFHGILQVKLIAGNAQVFGYQLECNKYVTVHSPRGHSLIYLMPTPPKRKSSNHVTTFSALHELKTDFLAQDIDELIEKFNQGTDAIILLERDTKHKGVNMIDRYMRETMFPNINAFNNESPYYASEFILHCQFSHWPRNGLTINEAWSSVPMKNTTKLATIGGKGVGKSTFVRYTINSNINKLKQFVFIDLDIGQPELFVPQTISATLLTSPILGPGYLENIPPTKAIFFGEINVLLNPIKYLRCVVELYEFCSKCEAFQNVPWVINTMGYSRSLGPELMACILRIFKPTDVVQIQSDSANENFESIVNAEYVNTFKFNIFAEEMVNLDATPDFRTHTFNTIIGSGSSSKAKQADMSPKDIRYAMVLSKLGNCLRCNSDWLTSIRPFEVSLNDLRIIVANGDSVDPASVTDVLNANLVYLCENKAEHSDDIVDCYGIGIVRAIDTSTDKLYLLSSIPLVELANVNVLAIGAIPLPSAVLLNQHGQVRGKVPFVYNSDGFVGSKQVAQHIFRSEKNRKNNPIELMEH